MIYFKREKDKLRGTSFYQSIYLTVPYSTSNSYRYKYRNQPKYIILKVGLIYTIGEWNSTKLLYEFHKYENLESKILKETISNLTKLEKG